MSIAQERKNSRRSSAKFTGPNNVRLVRGGKEYFDLLHELIRNARETIHLQTYIFDEDETGRAVAAELELAARRGVAVYVLVDGYASRSLSREFVAGIRNAGVYFRFFEPLFRSSNFYFGRRLHHKIFVADALHCLIGGINISNRYNDMPEEPAWLDFGFYTYGRAAHDFCVLCSKTWKGFKTSVKIPPCALFREKNGMDAGRNSLVRICRNDWMLGKNQISRCYLRMFRHAKSSLVIMSSYFLPGNRFKRALRKAAAKGVKIKVIVAGDSDVVIAKNAERFMYDWLLRHNIEIYEVQGRVLHAKVAVCDGDWMTVGSYNVNDISANASIEANVEVSDAGFVGKVEDLFEEIIRTQCVQVNEVKHVKTKGIIRQPLRWMAYQFIRVVLFLSTFYFKRKRED